MMGAVSGAQPANDVFYAVSPSQLVAMTSDETPIAQCAARLRSRGLDGTECSALFVNAGAVLAVKRQMSRADWLGICVAMWDRSQQLEKVLGASAGNVVALADGRGAQ